MASFGRVEPFDSENETWSQYAERLEHYFLANDVQDAAKKRAIFLTVLGPTTYSLLRSLLAPAKLTDRTFEELVQVLGIHFNPAPSEIVERFRFNSRIRKGTESIATFVSQLRKLAEHCNYGATLDTMLRDRLVCGIQENNIQKRLLAEPGLTLNKAMEIALAMETATRNACDLQSNTQSSQIFPVHKFSEKAYSQKGHLQQSGKMSKGYNQKFQVGNQANTYIKRDYKCIRCGSGKHAASNCPFLKAECHACSKVGHISKVCMSSKKKPVVTSTPTSSKVHQVELYKGKKYSSPTSSTNVRRVELNNGEEYGLFHLNSLGSAPKPISLPFQINGNCVVMEIDTGSAFSIMSEDSYSSFGETRVKPTPTEVSLRTFTGELIKVSGTVQVKVEFGTQESTLPLLIVSEGKTNLCGRNWIDALNILNLNVNHLNVFTNTKVNAILNEYKEIFEPTLGLVKGMKAAIVLRDDAKPRFLKARSVPFSTREKVEKELERLQAEGIIQPIQVASWAAPIVPVLKAGGTSVRICGDFKQTINAQTVVEQYPIPKIDEILSQLNGGQKFTRLDLRDAYNQVELEEDSRQYVVINTQKGLYRYTRMPFGIASAPAIFQRIADTIWKGIPMTLIYFDDLLVSGTDDDDHLSNLEQVFHRSRKFGVKLKIEKCEFMLKSVAFLGYVIDSEGIHPDVVKVEAIAQVPTPVNVEQLRSFLGLILYYGKFVQNAATLLAPLYALLNAKKDWEWTAKEEKSFQQAKSVINSSSVLIHYDQDKELILACDASQYGVGAVLSHPVESSGQDRPIAFASRTLSSAERNYSQTEKEGLAVIFGVTKFRVYLLGRQFVLQTDHQALICLFSEKKSIPSMASSRIQRWAITLGAYSYTIKFRKGEVHGNADAMSRLPLPGIVTEATVPEEVVLLIDTIDSKFVSTEKLEKSTANDEILSQVFKFVQNSWPSSVTDDLRPYWLKRNELSTNGKLILWGSRVVIPKEYQLEILQELHAGHIGMSKMKGLARSLVWWPNMDQHIEKEVKMCVNCQQESPMPPRSKPCPWPKAQGPWCRIHIDYAGPLENNKMILVVVDAFSNWIEACVVKSASAFDTMEELRIMFARYGLPQCVVSDNGSHFTAGEFQEFLKNNGITHVYTAVYHPSSNGLVEKAVGTVKLGLRKTTNGTLFARLANILFAYRRSPVTGGTLSPAELFLGRPLRSRLNLLQDENCKSYVNDSKEVKSKNRSFKVGDSVLARNFGKGPKWVTGKVKTCEGRSLYIITTPGGAVRRHVDQIKSCLAEQQLGNTSAQATKFGEGPLPLDLSVPLLETRISAPPVSVEISDTLQSVRRSTRISRKPQRFE